MEKKIRKIHKYIIKNTPFGELPFVLKGWQLLKYS